MAKSVSGFDFNDLMNSIKEFSPFADTIDKSESATTKEWIHTGSYILNAVMSGSLRKGFPSNRGITLAGESGAGKTFLCMNFAKELQKRNYKIIYLDTEGAIGLDMMESFGIDVKNFVHTPVSDLLKLKSIVTNIISKLKAAKIAKQELPKVAIFLDSLGMLASSKELDDALKSSDKRDMSKAQMVRSFFRLVSSDLTTLGIPLIITNHIVTDIGSMFPQFTQSGGLGIMYSASITLSMTKAKLKDDKGDATAQTGVIVTLKAEKNRFAKPEKARIHIHYKRGMNPYIGLETFVSWDACGIQKGNILTEKEYSKLTDAAKKDCRQFASQDGELVYFSPKETARNYIAKHLGRAIEGTKFYTEDVFTPEVIAQLDENVIIPKFSFGEDSKDDSLLDIGHDEDGDDIDVIE